MIQCSAYRIWRDKIFITAIAVNTDNVKWALRLQAGKTDSKFNNSKSTYKMFSNFVPWVS